MASKIMVFDNMGNMLDEFVSTTTVRSWVLNDYGRCEFTMSTYDPKCNAKNLNYGNILLIQHVPSVSVDRNNNPQTNGQLPDWVGVIVPPRTWGINKVTVVAYSAEYIMLNRAMPDDVITDSAGGIFWELINYSNDDADEYGAIEIEPGQIDTSGATHSETLKLSALEHAKAVASTYGNDFDITPAVIGNGHLLLQGNFYMMKGVNTQFILSDGDNANIEFNESILTEQGTLGNAVIGYGATVSTKVIGAGHGHRKGRVSTTKSRQSTEDADMNSILKYGLYLSNQSYNVSSLSDIHLANQQFLSQNSEPIMTFQINAADNLKTFDNLVVGNVLQLTLTTIGFFGGQIGFQDWVRLDGVEYDDLQNKAKLIMHIYRPPLGRIGIQIPIGG